MLTNLYDTGIIMPSANAKYDSSSICLRVWGFAAPGMAV
jgi:hypothetical protein